MSAVLAYLASQNLVYLPLQQITCLQKPVSVVFLLCSARRPPPPRSPSLAATTTQWFFQLPRAGSRYPKASNGQCLTLQGMFSMKMLTLDYFLRRPIHLDNLFKLKFDTPIFACLSGLQKSLEELELRYMNRQVKEELGNQLYPCRGLLSVQVFEAYLPYSFRRDRRRRFSVSQIRVPPSWKPRTGTIHQSIFHSGSSRLTDWNDEIWGIEELKQDGLYLSKMAVRGVYE
ncbi:hypothetical protein AGABI2DRAFT_123275 [Agaricus bisporus var. bisporus H97]|uniref:hypothetical protein n=1 Tax=Agaricus bisporus var. bisporus (strain H97 / ATCC MYA-4626 / FGSC 10389) TaxID=936046 RepID=UPI00029F7505|nr:hypothetical protein AGABI2DRAFT_123275 [Agaricus bisporus var. bisporus H97]EKV41794.1 hypothetical protein AGABI2DRAFT_123275 [Agaricus bisporus var. bisporus H97]